MPQPYTDYALSLSPSIESITTRIVAGPVLRRLTRRSVTVWAALQSGEEVRLTVRSGTSILSSTSPVLPTRVGQKLWIACLTLDMTNDFQADTRYEYWLEGAHIPAQGTTFWNALSDVENPGANPSFLGPPDALDNLRIATTSCRKPHGEGRDALAQLASHLTASERPHLLILSGDQIYGDDVVSPLMARVKEVAEELVGVDETDFFAADEPPAVSKLGGRRTRSEHYVRASTSHNHLWTLGEYLAMYLLAWSDTLWPDAFPSGESSNVREALRVTSEAEGFLLSGDLYNPVFEDAAKTWDKEVELIETYRQDLPLTRRVLANVPSLMMFDDHEVTDDWNIDHPWCQKVYGNKQGRQIIANGLLAYTLCQHWGNVPERFQTEGTAEREVLLNVYREGATPQDEHMLDRLAVPRGIVNEAGEIIELIVQAQADFAEEATRGKLIYNADMTGETPPGWGTDAQQGLWVPHELPFPEEGEPPPTPWVMRTSNDERRIDYHFRLGIEHGYPVNIVLLDERTCRQFDHEFAPCHRVNESSFDHMWPAPNQAAETTILVCPSPLLGLPLFEHTVQPAVAVTDSLANADLEGWRAQSEAFERVLSRAHAWGRVVILSGDVHFGYTRHADITKSRQGEQDPVVSRVIQFCVSASKNASSLTTSLHWLGQMMMTAGLIRDRTFRVYGESQTGVSPLNGANALPWDVAADFFFGRIDRALKTNAPIVPLEAAEALHMGPGEYEYTVYHHDDRHISTEADLVGEFSSIPPPSNGWDPATSLDLLSGLRAVDLHRIGRVLQGLPMIGRLHFEADKAHLELVMPLGQTSTDNDSRTSVFTQVSLEVHP